MRTTASDTLQLIHIMIVFMSINQLHPRSLITLSRNFLFIALASPQTCGFVLSIEKGEQSRLSAVQIPFCFFAAFSGAISEVLSSCDATRRA